MRVGPSKLTGAGLGVFAERDLEPGETLCSVPTAAILVAPKCAAEEGSGLAPVTELAKVLLEERAKGASSKFAAYISDLPPPGEVVPEHPLFWPETMRTPKALERLFRGSSHASNQIHFVLAQAAENIEALLSCGAARDEDEARWALATVDSRVYTFQADTPDETLALVPLLDRFNTFAQMKDGEALWQCSFYPSSPLREAAVMKVERPVKKGDELLHLYEANSSLDLWTVYGFLPDAEAHESPFEIAALEIPLEEILGPKKELRDVKLETLEKAGVEATDLVYLELPGSAEGGSELLPAARIAVSGSEAELKAINDALERLGDEEAAAPVVPLQLEAKARSRVADWAQEALQRNERSAADLLEWLESRRTAEEKRIVKMAITLLGNERLVIESELSTSREFCESAAAALREGEAAVLGFQENRYDPMTGWLGAG